MSLPIYRRMGQERACVRTNVMFDDGSSGRGRIYIARLSAEVMRATATIFYVVAGKIVTTCFFNVGSRPYPVTLYIDVKRAKAWLTVFMSVSLTDEERITALVAPATWLTEGCEPIFPAQGVPGASHRIAAGLNIRTARAGENAIIQALQKFIFKTSRDSSPSDQRGMNTRLPVTPRVRCVVVDNEAVSDMGACSLVNFAITATEDLEPDEGLPLFKRLFSRGRADQRQRKETGAWMINSAS